MKINSEAGKKVSEANAAEHWPVKVVYPAYGHQTFEAGSFLMGQVLGDVKKSVLQIQNHEAPLSEHGFFSFPVALQPGENEIPLKLTQDGKSFSKLWKLMSHKPLMILPEHPLGIHRATLLPAEPLALAPGDYLTVAFSASLDIGVWLEAPGLFKEPVLIPAAYPEAKTVQDGFLDNREPIFQELHQTKVRIPKAGYYECKIKIPPDAPVVENVEMTLVLRNSRYPKYADGEKRIPLPGRLSIWQVPRRAVVVSNPISPDGAVVRIEPPEGDRLTPLMPGAELWIDGHQGEWYRMRFSPQDTAWVHQSNFQWQSQLKPSEPPYVLASNLSASVCESDVHCGQIKLQTALPLPVHIEAYPNRVSMHVYGATAGQHFERVDDETAKFFQHLQWQQTRENVLEVQALLASESERIAGFHYAYERDGICLKVNTLPKDIADIRILLDAGHGGAELGSVGLSGIPEKELNLAFSKRLQAQLYAEGFQHVDLTRMQDKALALTERGAIVRKLAPHIVLSLHHNALPDGRDPRHYEGACCFYYHPFSKPLAQSLQRALVGNVGMPDFGVLYESFYMTRIPQALAVLVELGFFTNPNEYERLINSDYQNKMAQALSKGLRAFCETGV